MKHILTLGFLLVSLISFGQNQIQIDLTHNNSLSAATLNVANAVQVNFIGCPANGQFSQFGIDLSKKRLIATIITLLLLAQSSGTR